MTIKEFADKRGLTKGAIYKAIKSSSFRIDQITGRNGRITEEGREILRILFPEPLSEPLTETKAGDSPADDLRTRLSEAERALEKAEDALKVEREQRALFEKLYNEAKEELRQQRESAERERTIFYDKISELTRLTSQQQELARLATMNPIKRLFSGRKRKQEATIDTSGEVN